MKRQSLKSYQWGTDEGDPKHFKCRGPRCRFLPITDMLGFVLPFCLGHCEQLPPRVYRRLSRLSCESPYDRSNVAQCEAAVARCSRYLSPLTARTRRAIRRRQFYV